MRWLLPASRACVRAFSARVECHCVGDWAGYLWLAAVCTVGSPPFFHTHLLANQTDIWLTLGTEARTRRPLAPHALSGTGGYYAISQVAGELPPCLMRASPGTRRAPVALPSAPPSPSPLRARCVSPSAVRGSAGRPASLTAAVMHEARRQRRRARGTQPTARSPQPPARGAPPTRGALGRRGRWRLDHGRAAHRATVDDGVLDLAFIGAALDLEEAVHAPLLIPGGAGGRA